MKTFVWWKIIDENNKKSKYVGIVLGIPTKISLFTFFIIKYLDLFSSSADKGQFLPTTPFEDYS